MSDNLSTELDRSASTATQNGTNKEANRRFTVIRVLTDLFLNDNGRMSANERNLHEEVLYATLSEAGPSARREIAERFAASNRPPQKVLRFLLRDEIDIARNLLLHSPAISDTELVSIAQETTLEHRLAIAQRGRISSSVVDALIATDEPCILLAVARNHGAEIGEESLHRLTAWSRHDSELAAALVSRDGNDSGTLCNLFWDAESELRGSIIARTGKSESNGALAHAPIRVSGQTERREAMKGLAALLTSQRQAQFQIFLAQMLGISSRLAARITADSSGEPFAIACKAAGFPGNAFTTLLLLYNPEVSQSIKRVYALSTLYEDLNPMAAWNFLEEWHARDQHDWSQAEAELRPAIHEQIAARAATIRPQTTAKPAPVPIPTITPPKRAVFGRSA